MYKAVYLFLFTEADKQLTELSHRIKYALAIRDDGVLDMVQFNAKQHLAVSDIIQLGEKITHPTRVKMIKRFGNKYREIEQGKTFLIINLFILTAVALSVFTGFLSNFSLLKFYIIISLIFGIIVYFYITKLPNESFINIQMDKNPAGKT